MRRLVLALFVLVLLRADMYQDASNAKNPQATNNLLYTPATCDAFAANDATTSTGGGVTTLTSPSAAFTSGNAKAYVGEPISIAGAGATWGLAGATVSAAGTEYWPGELLPLSLGNGAGTPAQLRVVTVKAVAFAATPVAGGTGATANGTGIQLVTLDGPITQGGTRPQFVGTVTGGVLTAVTSISTPGALRSNLVDPKNIRVTNADGSLLGAVISATMGVDTVIPKDNMGKYTTQSTGATGHTAQPFWSPGREGTGATFTLTYYRENHVTTIASVPTATTVTLAAPTAADVSTQTFGYGTDQAPAWAAAHAANIPVQLPRMAVCAASTLTLVNSAVLVGGGMGTSGTSNTKIIYIGAPSPTATQIGTPQAATTFVAGVTIGNFELDGLGAAAIGLDESGLQGSEILRLAVSKQTTVGVFGRGRRQTGNQPVQSLVHGELQISQNLPTSLASIANAGGLQIGRSDVTGTNYNLSVFSSIRATTRNGIPMQIEGTDTTAYGTGVLLLRGPTAVPGVELLGANGGYFPALSARIPGILDPGDGGLFVRALGWGSPSKRFDVPYYQTLNGAPPPVVEKDGGKWNSGATAFIVNAVSDANASGTAFGKNYTRIIASNVTQDKYINPSDSGAYFNFAGATAASTINMFLPIAAIAGNFYCFQTFVGTTVKIYAAHNATITLGGTVTVGDAVTLTFTSTSKGWTGGSAPTASYTAVTADDLGNIGGGLQAAVGNNEKLRAANVTYNNATSRPAANGTPLPTFSWWQIPDLVITVGVSGAATETASVTVVDDKIALGNGAITASGGYIFTGPSTAGENICLQDARALGTGNSIVGNGTWLAYSPTNINNWSIDGVPVGWTPYTPVVNCGSGTLTSAVAAGRYRKSGKTVDIAIQVTITTNGTCAGFLSIGLPAASAASPLINTVNVLTGYESVGGLLLRGLVNAAGVSVAKYQGAYPGADGAVVSINGTYEGL